MFILITWLLIVLIISVVHVPAQIEPEIPIDKIAHFVLYGITAILFFRVLRLRLDIRHCIFFSILFSSLYGFIIEIVQLFIPYRSFSLSDIAANTAGAVVFVMINSLKREKLSNIR